MYFCVYTIVCHILMHNTHSHVQHMLHTIHQSDDDDTLSHHTLSHARDLFHLTVCIFEWVYVLSFCTTLPCIVAEAFLITPLCAGWVSRNIGLYQRPKGHAWLCFRGQPGETDFQSTVHSRSPGGLKRIGLSYTINMQATASALERQQRQP